MRGTRPIWRSIGILALVLAFCPNRASPALENAPNGPHVVMIIRHAEKPKEVDGTKNPDLSRRGFERADALAKVIPEQFPRPDFLIATKASRGSNRPVETITPLAKALHENIDSSLSDKDFEQVARSVLTDPKYVGKIVLIAWHHGTIPALAKSLGARDTPGAWNSEVFDRVWEINYKDGVASWTDLPERALSGDSEK